MQKYIKCSCGNKVKADYFLDGVLGYEYGKVGRIFYCYGCGQKFFIADKPIVELDASNVIVEEEPLPDPDCHASGEDGCKCGNHKEE